MNRIKNIFKGFVAILIAIYLIGNDIGVIPDFNLWRALFGVVFTIGILEGIYRKKIGNTFACIAALYYTIQPVINAPKISIFILIIVVFLLSLAFENIFPTYKKSNQSKNEFGYENSHDSNEENVHVLFSDVEKYIYSKKFKSYDVNCTFGEIKLYFDNAQILNEEATLYVNCLFGEITLFVPKGWRVIPNVSTMFAEKSCVNQAVDPTKVLNIKGSINFAELRIIYI